jgi:probable HAF family extracellular repeat protein
MTRSIQSAAAVAAALAVLAGCDESILPTTERAVAPGTASFAISVGEPVLLTYFGSNDEGVAAAVNNSGTAVGYVYDSAGTYHPILWAPGGTAVRLGTDACPGRHPTAALGVNDAGQVVGMGFCDGDQDYTNMAVLWTAAGTHQPLGTMYDIFGESVATGINNNGHVVGWSASAPHRGFPGAFRWTAATGMQPLEWLVSYYESESGAYAVNDAGTVVGYSEIEYGEFEYRTVAVLWSAGGGIRAVAGYGSVAHDINEQGEVVGVMEVNGKQHAFRWTAAGGLVDMGPGSAYGINNYGVIVGTGSTVGAAWVWTQETGFIALPGSSPAAYDIGDDGTVVGRVGRRGSWAECPSRPPRVLRRPWPSPATRRPA